MWFGSTLVSKQDIVISSVKRVIMLHIDTCICIFHCFICITYFRCLFQMFYCVHTTGKIAAQVPAFGTTFFSGRNFESVGLSCSFVACVMSKMEKAILYNLYY